MTTNETPLPSLQAPPGREPDRGISTRAISIARFVDRLPEGEFIITLSKSSYPTQPWRMTIASTEKVWDVEIAHP